MLLRFHNSIVNVVSPRRVRGQPTRTALLTRMLRAAFTTACCPGLSPQLLGDCCCNSDEDEELEEEEERLVVTREMMASSTRGTTTAFQSRASHLNASVNARTHEEEAQRNRTGLRLSHTIHVPDDRLGAVQNQRAGQEELWAQQSFMGAQTRQTSVELLPNLGHPKDRALHGAIRSPNPSPHLEETSNKDMGKNPQSSFCLDTSYWQVMSFWFKIKSVGVNLNLCCTTTSTKNCAGLSWAASRPLTDLVHQFPA